MAATCTCGHDRALHESPRRNYTYATACQHSDCACRGFDRGPDAPDTPAPATPAAGLAAQPPASARIGAAGVTNEGTHHA